MSERYSRLFLLSENLYTEGAPVIIAAGTLLKDNQTGGILAQLKLQSISTKDIKAVKAEISPLDTVGNPLGEPVKKQYLDLSVARNMTFGQKTPIVLPDNSTRAYTVRVTEVAFQDNTVWKDTGGEWKSLLTQQTLTEALKDPELVKQYQLTYGSHSQFTPAEDRDLWLCSCGQVNHAAEERCSVCECSCAALQNVDFEALEKAKQARLAEEAQKAAEAKAKAEAARAIAAAKAKVVRKKLAITAAVVVPVIIALIIVNATVIVPKKKYNEAMALIESEKYSEAYEILEEIGKGDEVARNKYDRAMALLNTTFEEACAMLEESNKADETDNDTETPTVDEDATEEVDEYEDEIAQTQDKAMVLPGSKFEEAYVLLNSKFEEAYALLEEIGKENEIEQRKYDRALAMIDAGDFVTAYALLDGLNYKDSEQKKAEIKPKYQITLLKKAEVGATVLFGSYEQDNNTSNGKEGIKWIVLSKENNAIFVVSKYILDMQPYHTKDKKMTWENCYLRKWLNRTFYNSAFSASEQGQVLTTTVKADTFNDQYPDQGNDTSDKVFLLSYSEMESLFKTDRERACEATAYVKAQDLLIERGKYYWWLRTRTDSNDGKPNYAELVSSDGELDFWGGVTLNEIGVRPAMWISLDD